MVKNLANDESAKYLGIHIDTKLSFHSHIKHLVKKLSRQVSVVARLRHYVPRGTLLKYYLTYIEPIITYGLLFLWLYIKTPIEPHLHFSKKSTKINSL